MTFNVMFSSDVCIEQTLKCLLQLGGLLFS